MSVDPQMGGQPPKKSVLPWVLGGCGVVMLLGVVTCAGVAWWAASQAKNLIATGVQAAGDQMVDDSELTEEDKTLLKAQVKRLADGIRDGSVTMERAGKVMEELADSPLIPAIMVFAVEKKYIDESGLTDEEKADAKLQFQRVMRGVSEDTITKTELEPLLDRVATKQGDNYQLKDSLTDDEIKEFVASAKELTDAKGIPSEPFDMDIVGEFTKVVDKLLATE